MGKIINFWYYLVSDDPREMAWLLEAGVDGIITNRPDLLIEQFVRYLNIRMSYPRKFMWNQLFFTLIDF